MSVATATVVSSARSGCLCSKRRARCVFEKQLEKACGLRSIARHADTKIDASCHASARRAIAVNCIPLIDQDRPARVGNSARRNQRGQSPTVTDHLYSPRHTDTADHTLSADAGLPRPHFPDSWARPCPLTSETGHRTLEGR